MQCSDRILERRLGEDVRGLEIALDQVDDLPTRRLGQLPSARVDGRHGGAAGQRQPERLGHAGHRRRGAHRHAVPVRARHRVLNLRELLLGDAPCSQLLVVVPAVAARSELAAAPVAVQHRAAGDHDRRDVRARRAEDARGVRLVAAGEQHHAVERIRADGLLDVHRHQVAVQHRRGLHQRLAERHDGELDREAARLQHAALDGFGQPAQVDVAVDELRPRVADPDHGPAAERLVRDARRLEPGSMQEPVEIAALEPLLAPPGPVPPAEVRPVSHRRHVAPQVRAGSRHCSAVVVNDLARAGTAEALSAEAVGAGTRNLAAATSSVTPQLRSAASTPSGRSSKPSKACPGCTLNEPAPVPAASSMAAIIQPYHMIFGCHAMRQQRNRAVPARHPRSCGSSMPTSTCTRTSVSSRLCRAAMAGEILRVDGGFTITRGSRTDPRRQ